LSQIRKMGSIKQIPNLITSFNLLLGCIAISMIIQGNLTGGASLIGLSLIMDFLDGFSARALDAYSPLGKQLDSLADLVSFGVAPAMILHIMILQSFPLIELVGTKLFFIGSYLPFILVISSALRLAKFNIDESQTSSFKGLPTPASAIVVISLPFIASGTNELAVSWLMNSYVLVSISIALALLLNSNFRLFALKFKSYDWKNNKLQYLLIIGSIILFIIFNVNAVPIIILLYLILSLVFKAQITN